MLSEKGNLRETPPMKLLLTIFEQVLTGILYIKGPDVLKVLYFSRGKLIWAISNAESDKLENILLLKNLVESEVLQKVKKEAHVSESIGKILVEKGLITLEELIESTKLQLKRIIIDVLRWTDGGFQFNKDTPPERLLSLDLNITEFIVDYILEEMEISDVWKSIGSLQIELIKNPDEEKLARYQLSDRQVELLNSFDGQNKLEWILSRHAGGHRESILKIVYFFIMAELLIKKEFELTDLSSFETASDQGLDYLDIPSPHRLVTPSPGTENTYTFGEEEPDPGMFPQESIQEPFPEPKESQSKKIAPPPLSSTMMKSTPQEEKKRVKFIGLTLVLVVVCLVIGGIILIMLPLLESDNSMEDAFKRSGRKDIIRIDDTKPDTSSLDTGSSVKPGGQSGEETVKNTPVNTKTEEKTGEDKPAEKTGKEKEKEKETGIGGDKAAQAKEEDKTGQEKKPVPLTVEKPKAAEDYFKEGSLITAGDVWKNELMRSGFKYSILLELDCQKESVMHAYNLIEKKKEFFILTRKSKDKNRMCYMVMWGKFRTREEAGEAVKTVPNYFWKQQNPPEVVELAPYFK